MSKKGILFQYKSSIINLPGKVAGVLDRVSFEDLKVLIALADHPDLCQSFGEEDFTDRLAELSFCDKESVHASLAFWRGAGILTLGTSPKNTPQVATLSAPNPTPNVAPTPITPPTPPVAQPTPQPNTKPIIERRGELPQYSSEELAALLESRKETQSLISDCQRVWGKMFNTQEVNIILGLVDFLELDADYVLSLLAYFKTDKVPTGTKASLRNVEKYALDLYDRGIQTTEHLHHEIERIEQFKQSESQLRTLFGMGGRALTPSEKKHFSTWLYDFGYGMDIIRMAYDVTVDAKGSPNIKYMNSVLANWHKDGLKTPSDVTAAAQKRKEQNQQSPKGASVGTSTSPSEGSTFDTDDFFAAAVRRNFGGTFDGEET